MTAARRGEGRRPRPATGGAPAPGAGEALPPRPAGPADPFVLMDRMDDEAILAELEGLVADTLVYHYQDGGREVWGLAKAGVDEACAQLANQGYVIREQALRYRVDERRREAYFCVQAARYAVFADGHEVALDTAWGAKRQPLVGDGGRFNPHWFEQGAMKAARNARSRLIGAELKARIIQLARETGKVRDVGAGQAPAAATSSGADEPAPTGPATPERIAPAEPRMLAEATRAPEAPVAPVAPEASAAHVASAAPAAAAAAAAPAGNPAAAAPAATPRQLQALRRLLRGPDVPDTFRRRVAARVDAGQLSADDARRAIGFLTTRRRLPRIAPAADRTPTDQGDVGPADGAASATPARRAPRG
ncbi:MAG: hypothetical protein IRZ00_19565 [Gemmatimonadetes bacterium]|nr:hypothetical protein [Gemmatimonadota bacterium]